MEEKWDWYNFIVFLREPFILSNSGSLLRWEQTLWLFIPIIQNSISNGRFFLMIISCSTILGSILSKKSRTILGYKIPLYPKPSDIWGALTIFIPSANNTLTNGNGT